MKFKSSIIVLCVLNFQLPSIAQPPSLDYQLVFSDHFSDGILDQNAWWNQGKVESCISQGKDECEGDFWYLAGNVSENNEN